MKKIWIELIKLWLIAVILALSWQALELLIMGEVAHRAVDDVIVIIPAISVYYNLKPNK